MQVGDTLEPYFLLKNTGMFMLLYDLKCFFSFALLDEG